MSDELLKAEVWYKKECECPYCGEIMETEKDSHEEEECLSCDKVFILGEFQL